MLSNLLATLLSAILLLLLPEGVAGGNIAPALVGTWSTGNGAVLTGPTFLANPVNNTTPFNYPPVAGISFSFTDTGYFEQAEFRFVSNASSPHCIQAVVIWQHGTYQVNSNGSLTTSSDVFAGDGRIQVQDACASVSSVITYYNQPGLYSSYVTGPWRGKNMLQLQAFDGSLMPRMYQVATDPKQYMYPTASLSNATNTLN